MKTLIITLLVAIRLLCVSRTASPGTLTGVASRLYRFGLRFLPHRFCERYREEMLRVFDESLAEARAGGPAAAWTHHLRVWADLARSLAREWAAEMDRKSLFVSLAATVWGIAATYIDFHATEVQATVGVFLVGGFLVGSLSPRDIWRAATLMAIWLPLINVIVFALRHVESAPGHPFWSRVLLLLPALIASLLGAGAGFVARTLWRAATAIARAAGMSEPRP